MPKYFSKFPLVYYNLSESSSSQLVTNILSRFVIERSIRDNISFYDFYNIKDGDTPENLAFKFYKSSERHWLILGVNDIFDIETQWPLSGDQLNRYINQKYSEYGSGTKYGGIEWAAANYKGYYKFERTLTASGAEKKKLFEIDANSYPEAANTTSSELYTLGDGNTIRLFKGVERKTYFDYEVEENEAKRRIRILRFQFVDYVEQEIENVFNEYIIRMNQ